MSRYAESRDRSAELLRMVLQRMAAHPARFSPVSYAVWYEHLAGLNGRLSAAIEQRLAAAGALDDAFVAKMHETFVADVDAATAGRLSCEMGRVMNGLSESAASTGGAAGAVGGDLEGLSRALRGDDLAAIGEHIEHTLASAAQLRRSIDALREQVAHGRQEIERLRGELDRTRDEAVLCPLTGLLNRKGFDHRLSALFDAAAGPPASLCLVMLDVDHFKSINDAFGHVIGDRVLAGLGEVLRRTAGETGAATVAARIGGEEFAVLMPGCTVGDAQALATNVRSGLRQLRVRQRQGDTPLGAVTVSIGIAVARVGDDGVGLVGRADDALYTSKRNGRDRVTVA